MSLFNNLIFSSKSKLPIIYQTESSECGLACLAMVCNYYGHHISLFELRQKHSISLKGATLEFIIQLSTKLNLSARPLRLELSELTQLRTPCILHVNMDHFVVLKEATLTKITVIDPAIGLRKYSYKEFSKHFTGIALELWASSKFEEKEATKSFKISSLIKDLKSFIPSYVYILILAIVLQIIALISPLYMQFVLDNVIPEGDNQLLLTLSIAFTVVLVLNILISLTQSLLGIFVSTTLSVQWKYNILHHLVNLPQTYFFKRHLGDILSRFNSIEPIQTTLTSTFIVTIINAIMAVFTFALMCYMSIKLALISFITLSIYLLIRVITYIPLRNYTEKGIVYSANQSSYLMETLRGMRIVKTFNKQNDRAKNWLSLYIYQTNNSIATQNFNLYISIFYKLIFGVEGILIVWIGASLVIDKTFTVGFLMAFISYKSQFASSFSGLIDSYIKIKMLSLYGERLSDIVLTDQEDDHVIPFTENQKNSVKGAIEVKDLSFKYGETDSEVIKKIGFSIEAGQSVSITGPSGEGKSTLMNLL
ncbi:peptidase domain-containing ABC transporter, partial [Acinetobacter guillouiae]|uniref:peptidase domain-containing ABC transporter n=1 Tax=Acinetobacter guillouiae TaxID=106649 RepID=UPI002FDB953F